MKVPNRQEIHNIWRIYNNEVQYIVLEVVTYKYYNILTGVIKEWVNFALSFLWSS